MLRPCVPTRRSLSRGCTRMSSTRTRGRPVMNGFHSRPPSSETSRPNSVPTKSRAGFLVSSSITFTLPRGRLFVERLPGPAVVARHVDVRVPVVVAVVVEREVAGGRVEPRRLDARHLVVPFRPGDVARDIGPRDAAVPAHLHVPIVGAHPDEIAATRRFGERRDVAVVRSRRRSSTSSAACRAHP